jgi:hypothetical protein
MAVFDSSTHPLFCKLKTNKSSKEQQSKSDNPPPLAKQLKTNAKNTANKPFCSATLLQMATTATKNPLSRSCVDGWRIVFGGF